MVISEENYVMLLTHEKFRASVCAYSGCAHSTGICGGIECADRAAVDAR